MENEVFITVITGVLVFIISQFIMECIIKPNKQFREIKGRVAACLTYNAQCYANPIIVSEKNEDAIRLYSDASKDLRQCASEGSAFVEIRPIIAWKIPNKKRLRQVSSNLIGLSHGMIFYDKDGKRGEMKQNLEDAKEIKDILGLTQD